MSKKKQIILVTGGAGYIGSQTCKLIKAKGYLPLTYDNLSSGSRKSVKWGKLIFGNIGNTKLLKKVISKYKPNSIFHFAALTSVEDSQKFPKKYYNNNVLGSKKLIDTAGKLGIKNFIFSSTCAVYGNPKSYPINISSPTKPINNYGKGKLDIENYLKKAFSKYGMSSVSLRYFNASGADPKLEIGDRDFKSSKLIPRIISSIMNNSSFNIYGSNYPTKDGTCIRDYVHVVDLANAHLSALKYLKKKSGAHKFNLGSGIGYSILDIVKLIEKYSGKNVIYKYKKRRSGDPVKLYTSKNIDKKFNWKPKRSKLKYIIKDALGWYEKNYKHKS